MSTTTAVYVPLDADELILICDHLAAGQLAKTYNLFNKLVKIHQENYVPKQPMSGYNSPVAPPSEVTQPVMD